MTTKQTEKDKGISILSAILIILIVGSVVSTIYIYWSYERELGVTGKSLGEVVNEVNDLRDRMERLERVIPKDVLEEIYNASEIKFGMEYVEVTNYTLGGILTKAIVFKNSGDMPLSDFKVLLNGKEIEPYYKPVIVFARERGIVVLQFNQWIEWASSEGIVKIKSVKDLSLDVKAEKPSPSGITGFFVLK